MNRRPLIAGNWKMYLSVAESVRLAQAVAATSATCPDLDVMVAPAFTSLAKVCEAVGNTSLKVAAQNVAWAKEGAFTGEIAPPMLTDLGVRLAIVGHSERRQIFGESDAMINRRLLGALAGGLQPVFCVGETLEEREADRTFSVLEHQVRQGLQGVTKEEMPQVVLAYEPVWAIGTGKTATKEQAQEAHAFLRRLLAETYEKNIAEDVRILYGGSVKPDNIDSLMAQPDIDGALVGGAALKAESFERIIRFQ
ncbi:MAG: triose-phosphate isomerase [Proteobacteria bacterium]|nr:triose-phosphate isomerase [Pseudomonadota bacterium]